MAKGPLTNGVVPLTNGEVHEKKSVVLKFGGTSVGKYAPEIAQICL